MVSRLLELDVKMQWIQDPSQSNVDILNAVRREVSRHFREKRRHI